MPRSTKVTIHELHRVNWWMVLWRNIAWTLLMLAMPAAFFVGFAVGRQFPRDYQLSTSDVVSLAGIPGACVLVYVVWFVVRWKMRRRSIRVE